jgi:hypothetical protein
MSRRLPERMPIEFRDGRRSAPDGPLVVAASTALMEINVLNPSRRQR